MKDKVRFPNVTKIKVSKNDKLVATLCSFPGWGEKRARRALKAFGSLEVMSQTSSEEIAKRVYRCGVGFADKFHEHFRRKYKEELR